MKLTNSIVAIIALSSMSFAGGDIIEPVFEQETVEVPVEPVYVPAPVEEEYIPAPTPAPEVTPVVPAPVAPTPVAAVTPVVVAPVVAEALGLYIAGGPTLISARETHEDAANLFAEENIQDRQLGFTGRLGYDFMDYLGAEVRGTYGTSKVNKGYNKFKQVGAYLKPNYDITKDINLYGLIGASKTNLAGIENSTETGFSYGAGLDYSISDKVSIFTDAVNYMAKSDVPNAWGLTIGAGYQF